ncbi:uncharacterized protein A4U43_C06F18490 [Asparagus officinalis]|uniref:Uncharacterized protein n=1 Tax=Asparagus officinalis TaxID=4686 RepID=A0A5P1ER48_ASPOF|nr:uncharacterized protein A4U43_C06F18490 [Asparagus officinalis]
MAPSKKQNLPKERDHPLHQLLSFLAPRLLNIGRTSPAPPPTPPSPPPLPTRSAAAPRSSPAPLRQRVRSPAIASQGPPASQPAKLRRPPAIGLILGVLEVAPRRGHPAAKASLIKLLTYGSSSPTDRLRPRSRGRPTAPPQLRRPPPLVSRSASVTFVRYVRARAVPATKPYPRSPVLAPATDPRHDKTHSATPNESGRYRASGARFSEDVERYVGPTPQRRRLRRRGS